MVELGLHQPRRQILGLEGGYPETVGLESIATRDTGRDMQESTKNRLSRAGQYH